MSAVTLRGSALTTADVVAVARRFDRVEIAADAIERLVDSRAVVARVSEAPEPLYGINTGFGKLASVRIPARQLGQLQRNLILSHASGLGDALPVEIVRAIMLLRVNTLLQPVSGVRPIIPQRLAAMLNAGIHPVVPELGSVGASGDLAPLAHIAFGLIGEGDADVTAAGGKVKRALVVDALRDAGIDPVVLQAKEGLSLVNGTQAQCAFLALFVHDAIRLWRNTHGAAALSLEALKGTPEPFDERLHQVRPHPGQVESAALMRSLLSGSEIRESHRSGDARVQDPYSLRCIPQIMGAVKDALDHADRVAAIEMNASTDNPLIFGEAVLSGGNFHGQPVAMALDFGAIAMTSVATASERRLERIVNPDLSPGLPAFLAATPGLESGLMMVQIAAASLVGECRVLCTPACVQSIPTDGNQEDVVPMGMAAAIQARRVLEHTRRVVACELVCAAQGIEHHRPLRSSEPVEAVYAQVRHMVEPLTHDRPMRDDIETIAELLKEETLV